jgi:hypothetical protein
MSHELIREELESIRRANPANELEPEGLIAFARNPNTALHSRLEWDDSRAAHQYRLVQARGIIRAYCTVSSSEPSKEVRVYVSLSDNRGQDGGYIARSVIETDADRRQRYALDTLKSVISLLTRSGLDELNPLLDHALALERRLAGQEAA